MAKAPSPLVVETQDASITTATISIKVIQVDRRQMTMGTFRQLPEHPLIDTESFSLYGTPWGRVNYHWGLQNSGFEHVLFQKDGRLYRALVDPRFSGGWMHLLMGSRQRDCLVPPAVETCWRILRRAATASYYAMLVRGERPTGRPIECQFRPFRFDASTGLTFPDSAVPSNAYMFSYCCGYPSNLYVPVAPHVHEHNMAKSEDELEWRGEERRKERQELRWRIAHLLSGLSASPDDPSSIDSLIEGQVAIFEDLARSWDELMDQIVNLDQLFIAT